MATVRKPIGITNRLILHDSTDLLRDWSVGVATYYLRELLTGVLFESLIVSEVFQQEIIESFCHKGFLKISLGKFLVTGYVYNLRKISLQRFPFNYSFLHFQGKVLSF